MSRKLRMGMVGGGTDAFIGAIHRLAALMDNQIELVCGCFSVNPEISRESGNCTICPKIAYMIPSEMFEKEAKLPAGSGWILFPLLRPILYILIRQ